MKRRWNAKQFESQEREGVFNALQQEPASIWQMRKDRIRDYHTDFYFGYNLPGELFDQLVLQVLQDRPHSGDVRELTFNPELAPWHMLFTQGADLREACRRRSWNGCAITWKRSRWC